MSSLTTAPSTIAARRLWWAGPLTAIAAVAANLVVRALLFTIFNPPADFPPLQPPPIAMFTFAGTLLAAPVLAIVARFSRAPIQTFAVVAAVALVVSILPNLALMANPAASPFPGGSAFAFGLLIVFHVVAAVVCVVLLTALTRKR